MFAPTQSVVIFDNRGFLESAYNYTHDTIEQMQRMPNSIYESVLEAGGTKKFKMDNSIPDNLELPKDFNNDRSSSDGFVSVDIKGNW